MARPSLRITETEMIDALARAVRTGGPEEARTTTELQMSTGLALGRLKKALRVLYAEGRLVTHEVLRISYDGRPRPVPAYTILAKAKKS